MKKVECTADFGSSVEKVWQIVTDNSNYAWRSDLAGIEVSDGGNFFVERAKNGFCTEFSVTLKIPHERYEFDMKNSNMTGHWTGIFARANGRTKVTFTEEVEAKGLLRQLFSGIYLKKQQRVYIADLKKALGE